MKKGKKLLKVVLFTGYGCNNRCRFCVDADKRSLPERTTKELLRLVYEAGEKKADVLEIIGGEATIRPDFAALVRAARKVGVRSVACATNGRVLADPAAAREFAAAGLDSVILSLHGPTARVHDFLTCAPGSFAQLMKGAANLRRLGFSRINGNTTVVKPNMRHLPALARLYVKLGIRNVEYIFVDPNYGGAKNDFDALVPRISDAAPYMKKALRVGLDAGFGEWKVRYVPLCHFRGYESQISETNERELFLAEHWAPDFVNRDAIGSRREVGRRRPAACAGCRLYGDCEGLWVEYLKRYGDAELKAVKG